MPFPLGVFGGGYCSPLANPLGAPAADDYSLWPAYDSRAYPNWGADRGPPFKNGTLFPLWLNLTLAGCPSPYGGSAYFNGTLLFGAEDNGWEGGPGGFAPTIDFPAAVWWMYEFGMLTPNRPQRDYTIPIGLGGGVSIYGPYYSLSVQPAGSAYSLLLQLAWEMDTGGWGLGVPVVTWAAALAAPIDQSVFPGLALDFASQNFDVSHGDFSASTVTIAQPVN